MKVLYDGWPLVYAPNSPEALHLLAILSQLPAQVQAVAGLPGASFHPLPPGVDTQQAPMPFTEFGRLRWEQYSLPRLARRVGASLLHSTTGGLALFGGPLGLVSPAGYGAGVEPGRAERLPLADLGGPRPGLAHRLRLALAQGAPARAGAILWPADLSTLHTGAAVLRLPPVVHPIFLQAEGSSQALADLDLPETYILYHGPTDAAALHPLRAAWTWAAASIGEYYPLVLINAGSSFLPSPGIGRGAGGEGPILLPPLPLPTLAALYRGCSAVFHPLPASAWDGALRLALASGKPLVALETPLSDALVGPAGYLSPPGPEQDRALGAALITVIVEENVAEALGQAAQQRAAGWQQTGPQPGGFGQALLDAYGRLLDITP